MRSATLNPVRSHLTARSAAARAFTLVEVMIAAIVMVLAITTAITTLQRGLQAVDTARGYTYASQVMQSELERLRVKSWTQMQALQEGSDNTVNTAGTGAAPAAGFTCTRTVRAAKENMLEIMLESKWRGYDGRPHVARFVTRYGKNGLYDYFYTSH
jgi:Tfp pilus assembly protein PilV